MQVILLSLGVVAFCVAAIVATFTTAFIYHFIKSLWNLRDKK